MDSLEFMAKEKLRSEMKTKMASISLENRKEKGLKISRNLNLFLKQDPLIHSKTIGGFSPLGDEPNWLSSFDEDLSSLLAFPRRIGGKDQQTMVFLHCRKDELLLSKEFGKEIAIPPEDKKVAVPDLLFVPAIAFSREGGRLGRGKGYYDRYLESFKGRRVGLCFSEQILTQVPMHAHDQRVEVIITENEIIRVV